MKADEAVRRSRGRVPGSVPEPDVGPVRVGQVELRRREQVRGRGLLGVVLGSRGLTLDLRSCDPDCWVGRDVRLNGAAHGSASVCRQPFQPCHLCPRAHRRPHHVRTTGTQTAKQENAKVSTSPRKLYVARHAERVDFTFGAWLPICFDAAGNYTRRDLNMPAVVPERKGGYMDYAKDSPLTNIGLYQATLTGNAMCESGVTFSHVFSSPSLRCIQTCTNILTALHFDDMLINVEPGLFEWLAWYPEGTPAWMTPAELKEHGFHINLDYKPLIETEELKHKKESVDQYYVRSFYVAQNVLKRTAPEGGNVLLVGHAATLETCTRQLTGRKPRTATELVQLVHKIPYCGLCVAQEAPSCGPQTAAEGTAGGTGMLSTVKQSAAKVVCGDTCWIERCKDRMDIQARLAALLPYIWLMQAMDAQTVTDSVMLEISLLPEGTPGVTVNSQASGGQVMECITGSESTE
ncbi:hypothetical protein HPB51_022887 [Rhipicephalus microplus]|uniref:Uncharacterized protein n=1 Tax=Rhipicephalus microplus TaxID=6941 RepID=A0A9J6DQM0_RHIMP|nr:hypothetical protein HPB51_022887 [Rhipicephalus microplus]